MNVNKVILIGRIESAPLRDKEKENDLVSFTLEVLSGDFALKIPVFTFGELSLWALSELEVSTLVYIEGELSLHQRIKRARKVFILEVRAKKVEKLSSDLKKTNSTSLQDLFLPL